MSEARIMDLELETARNQEIEISSNQEQGTSEI
jgi:hypothetical protein